MASRSSSDVDAATLKAMLADGGELALLDVREEGVFSKRHLFHAASLPLSRLELKLDRLVPDRGTRIVLCDDDETLAARAAATMRGYGYRDIRRLRGGVSAWQAAGFELFSGVNVPSKAFGEFVEHHYGTPSVSAEELDRLVKAGTDMVILDSRPLEEFMRMSIPGALDCPGAELVYRVHEVVKRPETLVVVNCAGRTRSIIGAQSLINAGVANKVVALRNGTMGWSLAGFTTDSGKRDHAPAPGAAALATARAEAARTGARFGVRDASTADVAHWRRDESRTLYLFDVRTADEYRAGHVAGSRHAAGGQLVQATDVYIGTRNARVVLVDSDGVRATMTASWLRQLGWHDVYVWPDALASAPLEAGDEPRTILGLDSAACATITPRALADLRNQGRAEVIDLATSLEYRRGHIPGARFAVRSRFAASLPALPQSEHVVITSPDGELARLAAAEVATLLKREVAVLDGGTEAWSGSGLPLATGYERMLDARDDVYTLPYDVDRDPRAAMQDYLTWEVALVEQMRREGIDFPRFGS